MKEKQTLCFDMFPYPSGAGLHVGHPLGLSHLMCIQDIKDIKDNGTDEVWVAC
jgi:hypothetical protein